MANAKQAEATIAVEAVPGGVSEPETTASDTTIPGGKYLAVDGKTLVNANGKPLKGDAAEDGE